MEIFFDIPGKPFGKQRPKFTTRGGYVKAVTPKDTVIYENLVKLSYKQTVKDTFTDEAMIEANITTFFEVPKSTSKTRRALMLEGKIRPTVKPDVDNIAKVVLDSLNGIAYHDDKQVVSVLVEKRYAEQPHVEVTLWDRKE